MVNSITNIRCHVLLTIHTTGGRRGCAHVTLSLEFNQYYVYGRTQECGNIEPTTGYFDLFSSLLSCSPYTLYTVYFQFTGHSLHLSDNVLHDWLFPHHWPYRYND